MAITICSAQNSPINPPSGWKVPNGAGTCSVGKSCADLAPAMMQSALGASPLEKNLRDLTNTMGKGATGSPEAKRAIDWAVEAFRQAGLNEVHTEKFAVPAERNEKHAKAVAGPVESENVVAEIRGREEPDEFVVLGTHLSDSSDAALVVDAARVIHSSGSVPRRSIRFVLFTVEGQRMLGSWAYMRAHHAELDRTSAAVLFNGGMGAVSGYSLAGRRDALASVREALAPLAPMGVEDFTLDARLHADRLDFILEGILTLDPNHKTSNERATPEPFDKADIAALKKQAGIAAITAYAFADTSKPIAKRQSRAQIDQLLKETGLGQEMKNNGFWRAWESGERGHKQ